jgi:hypothetical protein
MKKVKKSICECCVSMVDNVKIEYLVLKYNDK